MPISSRCSPRPRQLRCTKRAAGRRFCTFLEDADAVARLHNAAHRGKGEVHGQRTFSVDGREILLKPLRASFWRERRRRSAASAGERARAEICIATGATGETLDTTDKIKGVPGGLEDTNLISFDKDLVLLFGLEQAQNAPSSVDAEL